ncbi:MAG: ComEC/Rec2 family competence protein [Acidimicrobiia bacterium]
MAAAVAAWSGALCGVRFGFAACALGLVPALVARRYRRPAAIVFVAAAASGAFAGVRVASNTEPQLPVGRVTIQATAETDPFEGRYGSSFVVRPSAIAFETGWEPWTGPLLLVRTGEAADVAVGSLIEVTGVVREAVGVTRGLRSSGELRTASVLSVAASDAPHLVLGNGLRRRVQTGLADRSEDPAAALLAGLLIGDVAALPEDELDDLRRSGLTHFVAVSGGNVALFLAAWWLVSAPLGIGPRIRAATGLLALVVFVVATRWEPSVVRAATMASIVLGGRLLAVPVGPWTALGTAVTVLLLVSGDLATSLGFQLSVLATAGVIAGSRLFEGRRPKFAWAALGATMSAQAAVLPLLLAVFGTVPSSAPVANVVAAPLVALATSIGGIGALAGIQTVTSVGVAISGAILTVARVASSWPQLGLPGVAAVVTVGVGLRTKATRPLALAVGIFTVSTIMPRSAPWPAAPTVSFLDVGQGDATLLRSPDGAVALVDGGADPRLMRTRLGEREVARIDLLVVTHGDIDHFGGLQGVTGNYDVGVLWLPAYATLGPELSRLAAVAAEQGVAVRTVEAGDGGTVGTFRLSVLGPGRRFAGDNDGSVVILVEAGGSTVLLGGDVEAVAQGELPVLRPDVLLVPHHGSATTDLRWLRETAGPLAVISVGDNAYGHPSPAVVDALDEAGTSVHLTSTDGTVDVRLGSESVTREVYSR